jgi:hypothetical protein
MKYGCTRRSSETDEETVVERGRQKLAVERKIAESS